MRRLSRSFLLATILLAACQKSPTDQSTKALRGIRSWTATATLAARSWTDRRVPSQFAVSSIRTAAKSVRPLDSTFRASGQIPVTLASIATDTARRPTATLIRLDSAITRGDRFAAAAAVAQLDSLDAIIGAELVARGGQP